MGGEPQKSEHKGTLALTIAGKKKRTLKIKHGLWADLRGLHVDRRTRIGKWMDHLRMELTKHVGGNPSIAEAILIEQIVIKVLKVHLYHVGLFKDESSFGSKDHVLALQNSIRLDLQALGLKGRAETPLTLEEYLRKKGHYEEEDEDEHH